MMRMSDLKLERNFKIKRWLVNMSCSLLINSEGFERIIIKVLVLLFYLFALRVIEIYAKKCKVGKIDKIVDPKSGF